MGKILLQVPPLSINKAFQGRRFKSDLYTQFEKDVTKILVPCSDPVDKTEMFVHYVYHIKNYGMTDTANMEKVLTDMLVKRGYLLDDRYIRAIYQRKERLQPGEDEWIDIIIEPYIGQDIK